MGRPPPYTSLGVCTSLKLNLSLALRLSVLSPSCLITYTLLLSVTAYLHRLHGQGAPSPKPCYVDCLLCPLIPQEVSQPTALRTVAGGLDEQREAAAVTIQSAQRSRAAAQRVELMQLKRLSRVFGCFGLLLQLHQLNTRTDH